MGVLLGLTLRLARISPRDNIWVTWANRTNQTAFCLSLRSVNNPFRTCLIGVPTWTVQAFNGLVNATNLTYEKLNVTGIPGSTVKQYDGAVQCRLIHLLNTTLLSDPEKLELFGCANASLNGSKGGWFSFEPINPGNLNTPRKTWATLDSSLESGSVNLQLYSQCNGSNITQALRLPDGIFLICGDRA